MNIKTATRRVGDLLARVAKPMVLLFVVLFLTVGAASTLFCSSSYALTSFYKTDDSSIKVGMVVAASAGTKAGSSAGFVEKASTRDANLAIGVVVDRQSTKLAYVSNSDSGQVLVSNSGQVTAYVSDVNGAPQPGDLLAPSPLKGILMRATPGTDGIVGAMIGDFPNDAKTYELKNDKAAKVAAVTVNLDIHPSNKVATNENAVQSFASSFVGHDVSAIRAISAFVIALLTVIAAGIILYGAIANYLKSLGRNPLAKSHLRSALYKILIIAVAVIIVGAVAAWVLLWL